MNIQKQLGRVYAYSFASCLRVANAVWVVLLCARGYSLWQVGLAEGIFHITSLLAEIPSGMAADLLGRRRTLALSGVMAALSGVTMAVAPNYALVALSMAASALSYNLISGTQEALTYDSLKQVGRADEYLQIDARVCQLQTLGEVLSDFCSMLTGVLSFAGFYLVDACIGLMRTLAALGLQEPVVTEEQAKRAHYRLRELPQRFARHTAATLHFLRGSLRVGAYIAADAVICLPCYLTTMYLQQRLADLGLPTMLLGLPLLCVACGRWLGVALARRLQTGPLLPLYGICAVLTGACTALAGAAPVLPAVLGAFGMNVTNEIWTLHSQKTLNDLYPSDQRATLVSVDSMAYSVLMIVASPLTGAIGDAAGNAGAGLCALGGVLVLSAAAAGVRLIKKYQSAQ